MRLPTTAPTATNPVITSMTAIPVGTPRRLSTAAGPAPKMANSVAKRTCTRSGAAARIPAMTTVTAAAPTKIRKACSRQVNSGIASFTK